MKKLMDNILRFFLVVVMLSVPLHGQQSRVKKVEAPINHIAKEVSLLDQIIEQAELVVGFEGPKSLAYAKKQLNKLMNNKELDLEIKEAIKDDVEIIKNTAESSRKASQQAYDRLVVIAQHIQAKANVIVAMEEGVVLLKNASAGEKEEAIKTAQEKILAAQEEEGILSRLYGGAKRFITAPVNYVFGEEDSQVKTAFYTTLGAAVLAARAYSLFQGRTTSDRISSYSVNDEEKKTTISELEKQNLLDRFKATSFSVGLDKIRNFRDKWKFSNYERIFLSSDDKWSYNDKKQLLEDAEFAMKLKKIAQNSELIINELVYGLRKWDTLIRWADAVQGDNSQEHQVAREFYDENILPIRKILIEGGVDLMDYLDEEERITSIEPYYDIT